VSTTAGAPSTVRTPPLIPSSKLFIRGGARLPEDLA
jgi:hypothetical protein